MLFHKMLKYFHLSFMAFAKEGRTPCKPPPTAPEIPLTDIMFQETILF